MGRKRRRRSVVGICRPVMLHLPLEPLLDIHVVSEPITAETTPMTSTRWPRRACDGLLRAAAGARFAAAGSIGPGEYFTGSRVIARLSGSPVLRTLLVTGSEQLPPKPGGSSVKQTVQVRTAGDRTMKSYPSFAGGRGQQGISPHQVTGIRVAADVPALQGGSRSGIGADQPAVAVRRFRTVRGVFQ